jgi:hypothetical protein
VPDYNNYLIYILANMIGENDTIRAMAGLYLKNNVATYYDRIHPEVRNYIKENCLRSLLDPHPLVRNTMGTLVTTIVTKGGLEEWPELLPQLVQLIDAPNYDSCEGALHTLRKICEDSIDQMHDDRLRPLIDHVISKCIGLLDSPHEKIRVHALVCLNQFIHVRSVDSLVRHLPTFMEHLYRRAYDPSPELRRYVCQSFVGLMDARPDDLMPHIGPVVEYMLHCSQDVNSSVVLEACEFWVAFAEQPASYDIVHPILPRLIPILLKHMAYSEEEVSLMRDIQEDASIPDREEDLKPRFHRAKLHGLASNEAPSKVSGGGGASIHEAKHTMISSHMSGQISTRHPFSTSHQQEAVNDRQQRDRDEEGEEEEEEEEDYDVDYSEWTLRKGAAAGLDMLANIFSEEILAPMMNVMPQLLYSPRWEQRESGILALGAVAEGCAEGVDCMFPDMMSYLVRSTSDSHVSWIVEAFRFRRGEGAKPYLPTRLIVLHY